MLVYKTGRDLMGWWGSLKVRWHITVISPLRNQWEESYPPWDMAFETQDRIYRQDPNGTKINPQSDTG